MSNQYSAPSAMSVGTVATGQRQSELSAGLNDLELVISAIETHLGELTEALHPVLSPQTPEVKPYPQGGADTPVGPQATPVGQRLYVLRENAAGIRDGMLDIKRRLEV